MALAPHFALVQAPELVTVKFRIQSAGAATNAPDFQVPAGSVSAATHASTGVYTVTMREKYPTFIGGVGTVMTADTASAGGDATIHMAVGDYDSSTGVLTFRVVSADGSSAVEAVADNEWIYLELTFCRNSTLAQSGAVPI